MKIMLEQMGLQVIKEEITVISLLCFFVVSCTLSPTSDQKQTNSVNVKSDGIVEVNDDKVAVFITKEGQLDSLKLSSFPKRRHLFVTNSLELISEHKALNVIRPYILANKPARVSIINCNLTEIPPDYFRHHLDLLDISDNRNFDISCLKEFEIDTLIVNSIHDTTTLENTLILGR